MEREPKRGELDPVLLATQVEAIAKLHLELFGSSVEPIHDQVMEWLEFATSRDPTTVPSDSVINVSKTLSTAYVKLYSDDRVPSPDHLLFEPEEQLMITKVFGGLKVNLEPATIHVSAITFASAYGDMNADRIHKWESKFYSGIDKLYHRTILPAA